MNSSKTLNTRRQFLRKSVTAGLSLTALPFLKLQSASVSRDSNFLPVIGVCTQVDNSEKIKKYGYAFVEETVGRFFIPDKTDNEFALNLANLKKSPLSMPAVNSFIPANLKSVGPDVSEEALMTWAETTFKRLQQAGTSIMVYGSGGSRRIPDGFSAEKARTQFIELNKKFGSLAEKYGVTIVLEPLNYGETNLLNTVEEGIVMVREINHSNVRLLADLYHMLKNGESADGIVKAAHLLKHVHIAEKENRTAPGVAGDNFRPYFASLKKINYDGRLSIECKWGDMDKELPLALAEIRKQIAEVTD